MAEKLRKIQLFDRHSLVEISPVIDAIKNAPDVDSNKSKSKHTFNDVLVGINSLRLKTFAFKGTICSCCGLEATHFAIERDLAMAKRNGPYHLNLWSIKDGVEVLFTHDHTLSRGLGGKDTLENTTTMCCYCNWEKGEEETKLSQELKKTK